jgi:hypothetical protein
VPPLAGLDTVLEPSRLPRLSPWAKGCRPPRRASNDAEVLKLTLMGAYPGQAVPSRHGGREAALHSNWDTTVPWVIQGFTSTTPPSRALRSLLAQADDTFTCL